MLVDPRERRLASHAVAHGALAFLFACACDGCATESPTRTRASVQDPAPTPATVQGTPPAPAPTPATTQGFPPIAPEPWEPPPGAVASDAPPAAAASLADWVHGSFAVRFRGRTNGSEHDADLGGVVALDVADPANARISGHVQARVDVDLDGKQTDGAFGSLDDTYNNAVVSKLYLAYADIALGEHPDTSPGFFRVGRQSDPLLPEVLRIDGVAYTTRPSGEREVIVGGYAGVPVHLYESSNEGDQAFGAFVDGRPWQGGHARLDWMHIEDEDVLGAGKNDLLALGLWQQMSDRWRLEGEYSHLDGDPRDLRVRALYGNPDTQSALRFSYYELLEPQKALVTELDPYFEQLMEYEPYREANVNLSQPLTEHTVLDLGFDLRRLSHSNDIGEFNREWERYYATTTFSDFVRKGLALAVTADLWDDMDRHINTFGADLSYDPESRWKAAIGTYYSLYKYVFLELDERENVRTFYARTTYNLSKSAELEVLYELENDDLDTYNTLRLGARWRF